MEEEQPPAESASEQPPAESAPVTWKDLVSSKQRDLPIIF